MTTPLQRTAPVLSSALAALLDHDARMTWSFHHTVAARVLGDSRARVWWIVIAGGRLAPFKAAVWVSLIVSWIVLSILEVFKVGGYDALVTQCFWVMSASQLVVILVMGTFMFDTRIVWLVVRSQFFISNMCIAIVALFSVCDIWMYDERAVLTGLLLLIVAFISLVDGFPPELRRVVAMPVFALLTFTFAAIFLLLTLGRFPSAQERQFNVGNLNELASFNVTVTVTQIAADSTFAFMVLNIRLLLHAVNSRASGHCFRIDVHVRCVEDVNDKVEFFHFLNWLKVRPDPVVSTCTIPVDDIALARLMDQDGRVLWSARRTLLARMVGIEALRKIVEGLHGGSVMRQLVKSFFLLGFMISFGITIVLAFYHLISIHIMTVMCVLQILINVYITVTFFDLAILRLCLKQFEFWLNVTLGFIGAMCLAIYWNFDERTILVVPFMFIVVYVTSFDAVHPHLRESITPFVMATIIVFYVVLFTMLQLGRLPNQRIVILNLGELSGMATRPVTVAIAQLMTDVLIGHGGLFFSLLLTWVLHRRDHVLHLVRANVVCVGDPSFVHFGFLARVKLLGLGKAFEESRRAAVIDEAPPTRRPLQVEDPAAVKPHVQRDPWTG